MPSVPLRFDFLALLRLAVAACSLACGGCDQFARVGTRRVVFARGVTRDFSANGAYVLTRTSPIPPPSDLFSVVIDGGAAVLLVRAMGFSTRDAADGESYLPFAGDDLHKNYYPQVAPVTSDRYAWVFFDSIRHYGNLGSMRQIWGAALDLHFRRPVGFLTMRRKALNRRLFAKECSTAPSNGA